LFLQQILNLLSTDTCFRTAPCEEGHADNAAVSSLDITTCHSAVANDSNLADLAGSNNSHIIECVPLVSDRCDVAQTLPSSSEMEALVKTPQKNRTENAISPTGESTDLGPIDLIHEISPIPKSQKLRTRKRRSQSAAVLTSSPFKKKLMESKTRPKRSSSSNRQ